MEALNKSVLLMGNEAISKGEHVGFWRFARRIPFGNLWAIEHLKANRPFGIIWLKPILSLQGLM